MDAILLQILNGLDKGSAYALIALGLTLIFGTLGVVNFAHGALFMLGAFTAVVFREVLTLQSVVLSETETTAWGTPLETHTPFAEIWFGDFGNTLIAWSVPVSILLAVPVMLAIGLAMERGLIKHFYRRPHADQILVTFGLAIVLQEIVKAWFGANPIPQPAPEMLRGMVDVGAAFGHSPGNIVYPLWRFVYFGFAVTVIAAVFAFLRFTTFGMVVRAGMADRETVGLLGIDIDRRFTWTFGLAAVVAGVAGVMYTPILSPDYHFGMDFLVLSFVVVVVGGMGSLAGAVAAGFLLGILQSFASMNEVKAIIPGIDQIVIYLVAVVDPADPPARPDGPQGRDGDLTHALRREPTLRRLAAGGLLRRGAARAGDPRAVRCGLSGPVAEVRDLRDLRHRLQHPVRPDRIPVVRPRRIPRRRLLCRRLDAQAAVDERDPRRRPRGDRDRAVLARRRLHLAAPLGHLLLDPDARVRADELQPRLLGADPAHQRRDRPADPARRPAHPRLRRPPARCRRPISSASISTPPRPRTFSATTCSSTPASISAPSC